MKSTEKQQSKDVATKTAEKLNEKENEKQPEEKQGQTTKAPTVEKEKPVTHLKDAENVYKEEPTKEQKIINYVANSQTQNVDLVPLLKSLYPLVSHSEPAMYKHQNESKRLRVMLQRMVAEGTLVMLDEQYLKLGTHFYADGDTRTQYHTIDSVKIIAVK